MSKTLVKKIDIHVHTMDYGGIEVPRFDGSRYATPAEIIEIYDKIGVEKGVILPEIFPECGWIMQSNEEALRIAEKYKGHFEWFCDIDPRALYNSPDSDLGYLIKYYKSLGAKGIGEVVINEYADGPLMDNLFYHASKNKMSVTFHLATHRGGCYGLVEDHGLKRLEHMLKKYPDLVLLGHSQPFWAEIGADCTDENRDYYPTGKVEEGNLVRLMREYPGLCGDLSAGSGFNAVSRDPEFGYRFIEEFKHKLYYGTDICDPRNINDPMLKLSHWLDEAYLNDKISEEAYLCVSRKNAEKLLGL
ncbi:hypothetical protein SDC9_93450 [bioreactor metagenome]|uniref:Amidohydrolase-related domain-containing protein n=1 Tax=bioreactor metagenome TaxID=1076179 RepID=A0A645AAN5_9ZZZZ|nr:hypothetical protein [Oscillospiraceae bacterium]